LSKWGEWDQQCHCKNKQCASSKTAPSCLDSAADGIQRNHAPRQMSAQLGERRQWAETWWHTVLATTSAASSTFTSKGCLPLETHPAKSCDFHVSGRASISSSGWWSKSRDGWHLGAETAPMCRGGIPITSTGSLCPASCSPVVAIQRDPVHASDPVAPLPALRKWWEFPLFFLVLWFCESGVPILVDARALMLLVSNGRAPACHARLEAREKSKAMKRE
jgi:hypothetical protein